MPSCRGLRPTGSQLCGGQVAIPADHGLTKCQKCGRAYSLAELQILVKADAYDGELEKRAAERRKEDAAARAKSKPKALA